MSKRNANKNKGTEAIAKTVGEDEKGSEASRKIEHARKR